MATQVASATVAKASGAIAALSKVDTIRQGVPTSTTIGVSTFESRARPDRTHKNPSTIVHRTGNTEDKTTSSMTVASNGSTGHPTRCLRLAGTTQQIRSDFHSHRQTKKSDSSYSNENILNSQGRTMPFQFYDGGVIDSEI
jgi:hypothetical protein